MIYGEFLEVWLGACFLGLASSSTPLSLSLFLSFLGLVFLRVLLIYQRVGMQGAMCISQLLRAETKRGMEDKRYIDTLCADGYVIEGSQRRVAGKVGCFRCRVRKRHRM